MNQLSLQNQYNLIKEGKGAKDVFLKHAKQLFPHLIPNHLGFDLSVQILKEKSILTENTKVIDDSNKKESWEEKFNKFLVEAKQQEEKTKADLKKADKKVTDLQDKDYDNEDIKNIDNVIHDQLRRGIYTEWSEDTSLEYDQVLKIVLKNLAKDPIWYTKNSSFGIKGIGYTDELPGTPSANKINKEDHNKPVSKEKTKANVKDSLGKQESAKGKPKEIKKELTVNPKNSKGVKKLDLPGKGKIIKLKENQGLVDLLKESFHKNVTDKNYKSYIEEMIEELSKIESFAEEKNIKNLSIKAREEWIKHNLSPEEIYHTWEEWTGGMNDDDFMSGNYNMGGPEDDDEDDLFENKNINESEIDPTYTHFAVRKSNNKIVNGWEYPKDYTIDDIKDYYKMDIKDQFPDNKISDFTLYTKGALKKKGIDPFDSKNWEGNIEENSSSIENYYQNISDPKQAIEKAQKDYQHAVKQGKESLADKILGNLKSYLDDKGYDYKKDPRAVELLDDYISESFKNKLEEMVGNLMEDELGEGALEDADAQLDKQEDAELTKLATIKKQQADNAAKIANANKNI